MAASVGEPAPDFELESHLGGRVRLSAFRGRRHVIVAFHPLAWTPVCASQMQNYEADLDWFRAHDAHVLGISVDPAASKAAWAASLGGIRFDLLSDFPPRNGVARAYGVAHAEGFAERAVFVVDKQGAIAFRKVYDLPALPDNAEVRQAVERLATTPPSRT